MTSREQTIQHIVMVCTFLAEITKEFNKRAREHDLSKLESPEAEIFEEFTPKLAGSTYGSEEYKGFLVEMHVALDNHYKLNRHHPEHFEDGVDGMTLIDLMEMIADWKAATLRHNDGDILRSIEINTKRFKLSPQLAQILRNTVREFGWEERETDV